MTINAPLSNLEDLFPGRAFISVQEFVTWADISSWKFYDLVKKRKLRPRKIGRKTAVPIPEAARWMSELPESGPEGGLE